jgi:hypothetical protein
LSHVAGIACRRSLNLETAVECYRVLANGSAVRLGIPAKEITYSDLMSIKMSVVPPGSFMLTH